MGLNELNQLCGWSVLTFCSLKKLVICPDNHIFRKTCSDFSKPDMQDTLTFFSFSTHELSTCREQHFNFSILTRWEFINISSRLGINMNGGVTGCFLPLRDFIQSHVGWCQFSPLEYFTRLKVVLQVFLVIVSSRYDTCEWREPGETFGYPPLDFIDFVCQSSS